MRGNLFMPQIYALKTFTYLLFVLLTNLLTANYFGKIIFKISISFAFVRNDQKTPISTIIPIQYVQFFKEIPTCSFPLFLFRFSKFEFNSLSYSV